MLRLVAAATLGVATACDDQSFRPGPSGAPIVYYSAPVEGVVREVGGGPVAGQTVSLQGVNGSHSTTADAAGRFRFDGFQITPDQFPRVTTYRGGFITGVLPVPYGPQRPAPLSAEVRLQPILTLREGTPLRISLSNDDVDYGGRQLADINLPRERGPVKVIFLESVTDGPHTLRAEWSTADQLHLWAEIFYKEEFVEVSGKGGAALFLPHRWTRDPLNGVTVTVGLPRTARAMGGVTGVIDVTLTLTPVHTSP